jgi:hypothetical protein
MKRQSAMIARPSRTPGKIPARNRCAIETVPPAAIE